MSLLRTGICAAIIFSVMAYGTVEVWSTSVLEISAALLVVLWALLVVSGTVKTVHWNPLNGPLLAFLGVGLIQLIFRTTMSPFFTRAELLKLFACFLIFFVMTQAFRERKDFEYFAGFLMALCFGVSLLGIAEFFTANGKLYWTRSTPSDVAFFGPYVNPNHFAGFVELLIPISMALLAMRGVRRDLIPLAGLFTVLPIGALIMSGSRGGILSFLFEIGLLLFVAWSLRARKSRLGTFGFFVLAGLALVAWLGSGKAAEKFSHLRAGEVTLARRWSMVKGATDVFLAHPIVGSGLNTLVLAFPQYENMYDARVVDHAHNDYVEILADTGILGGLCALAFLILLFRHAVARIESEQGHFSRALHVGALIACSGILMHGFVDFNLHITANYLLFLTNAGLATSPVFESAASRRGPRRVGTERN
ncbi:MAG: O-antigen ligase family protein [Candidatus Acidiferrales bacterium]